MLAGRQEGIKYVRLPSLTSPAPLVAELARVWTVRLHFQSLRDFGYESVSLETLTSVRERPQISYRIEL
ncbi:hypothetical protein UC8_08470 [Roseimaritima ulvae]|uniref:Uncharacterized protein n=1 Tax=Roseimaritima ulvae TaxID=980254 RepID=A0A5B9QLJ0_9BACT|nr:hypothetical protein UC8_08470 [Roseimaritima ulvae]